MKAVLFIDLINSMRGMSANPKEAAKASAGSSVKRNEKTNNRLASTLTFNVKNLLVFLKVNASEIRDECLQAVSVTGRI